MKEWKKLFKTPKAIIGMIHVQALPGTPRYQGSISKIIAQVKREAIIYQDAGVHGIILENMHDVPYVNRQVGPEITAVMTAGANHEALAVALAAGLDFIRAEGFVFAHIADEGFMDGCAAQLMRYRKAIGAEHILVFTDIKKKHSSHAITGDVKIDATAEAAEFFLSDGLIITGPSTGNPVSIYDLQSARSGSTLPVIIGSGITEQNIHQYWKHADGFIVGSHFKEEGNWQNPVASRRVKSFMETLRSLHG
jgi:predicted TIM-barrel enzyme